MIDGELVAFDAEGRSRFQLLQNAHRTILDSQDLRGLPLFECKERRHKIMPTDPLLLFRRHRRELGTRYFEEAAKDGEEGIMAKRAAQHLRFADIRRPGGHARRDVAALRQSRCPAHAAAPELVAQLVGLGVPRDRIDAAG